MQDMDQIQGRVNFSLPAGLLFRLQRAVPAGQRSKLVARLLETHVTVAETRAEPEAGSAS